MSNAPVFNEWENWREAHLDWFKSLGIDTTKYIQLAGRYDSIEDLQNKAEEYGEWEAIQRMELYGFERQPANFNQDIAIIGINPRFDSLIGENKLPCSSHDNGKEDGFSFSYRLGTIDKDELENYVPKTAGVGLNWLLHEQDGSQEYSRSIFEALIENDFLPFDREELYSFDPREDSTLLNHIYYTNWFKYATKGTTGMKRIRKQTGQELSIDLTEYMNSSDYIDTNSKPTRQLPNTILEAELARVNPEIVLALGKYQWEFFTRPDAELSPTEPEQLTEEQVQSPRKNRYSLHGHLFNYSGETTSCQVIPLMFPKTDWTSRYAKIVPNQREKLEIDDALALTKQRLTKSLNAAS